MSQRAVIVVDLQNEYLPSGNLPLMGIEDATANAARLIEAARAKGDLVVFIRHEMPDPEALLFVPGSTHVEIIAAVQPSFGEAVVVKNFPNSFRDTNLEQLLDAEGVGEVVIVGAMSHMCIDAIARAAADLGFKAIIVHDACATLDVEFGGQTVPAAQVHAAYMGAFAWGYGQVTGTRDLLTQ